MTHQSVEVSNLTSLKLSDMHQPPRARLITDGHSPSTLLTAEQHCKEKLKISILAGCTDTCSLYMVVTHGNTSSNFGDAN